MTDSTTPAQRLNSAHRQIDKLTDEVATLQKVVGAQNQAIVAIQREWKALELRINALELAAPRGSTPPSG